MSKKNPLKSSDQRQELVTSQYIRNIRSSRTVTIQGPNGLIREIQLGNCSSRLGEGGEYEETELLILPVDAA